MPNGYHGGHGTPLEGQEDDGCYMVSYTCMVCNKWGRSMIPRDDPKAEIIERECPGCKKITKMKRVVRGYRREPPVE